MGYGNDLVQFGDAMSGDRMKYLRLHPQAALQKQGERMPYQQQGAGKHATFQFADKRPETLAQRHLQSLAGQSALVEQAAQLKSMVAQHAERQAPPIQRKANSTGLPDQLKTGVESLSGQSLDDVKVHYNSPKPATLQAHAFAQGTQIHLAPGQERHLPHEAWHVVQQKQGRVKATRQLMGKVPINDNQGLEREASVMGAKAMQLRVAHSPQGKAASTHMGQASSSSPQSPVQLQLDEDFNVGGTDKKNEIPACKKFAKKVSKFVDQAHADLLKGDVKHWEGIKIGTFLDLLNRGSSAALVHVANAIEERVYALMRAASMGLKWTPQYSAAMGGSSFPDIVINLDSGKEALIDVTSDRGHVLNKAGAWTTSKRYIYVAEAYFPSVTSEQLPVIKQAVDGKIRPKDVQKKLEQARNARIKREYEKVKTNKKALEIYNQYTGFSAFVTHEFEGDRTAAANWMREHGLGNYKGVPKKKGRRPISDTQKRLNRKRAFKTKINKMSAVELKNHKARQKKYQENSKKRRLVNKNTL